MRVVPVFRLRRRLRGDADIGLGDRPALIRQDHARRLLGRVDAEDIAGGAVQPDMAEVAAQSTEAPVGFHGPQRSFEFFQRTPALTPATCRSCASYTSAPVGWRSSVSASAT